MEIINNYFEEIHSTESIFRQPKIENDALFVPCKELILMGGHPLCQLKKIYKLYDCYMIFSNAYHSERSITEYLDSTSLECSTITKEPQKIVDIFSETIPNNAIKFEFEGRLVDPMASISEWIVYANSFSLHFDSQKSETLK